MNFSDKYQAYQYYLDIMRSMGLEVSGYREIDYGLQFKVSLSDRDEVLRIYESKKKGVRLDLSQLKSEEVLDILSQEGSEDRIKSSKQRFGSREVVSLDSDLDSSCLIGTDESGKGDYFGPLVIGGVYAGEKEKAILRELGVDDSKKISDSQISKLSKDIKSLCKYDLVVIGNSKYNEMYSRIGNLNKLLAWGHARVIENMLDRVDCSLVLSDQFGSPKLIEEALMERGKAVKLEQRPKAEENIVVAAASIIARDEFVRRMATMSLDYGLDFPKGASNRVKLVGKRFVEKYGRGALSQVAKLHFKTTDEL